MNMENITLFTQNSIRIRCSAGTIYIDPFHMREEPHDADFVLITHDHYDHYSPEDISKVSNAGTQLVVPEKMAAKLDASGGFTGVSTADHKELNGFILDTIPAYNRLKPFHPKRAGGVGYLLTVDGSRIYIAGDTDITPENEKVSCDIAIVPIGGTFTTNAAEAAKLINRIKPRVAIPCHYGSEVGKPEDAETFRTLVDPDIQVEIIMKY